MFISKKKLDDIDKKIRGLEVNLEFANSAISELKKHLGYQRRSSLPEFSRYTIVSGDMLKPIISVESRLNALADKLNVKFVEIPATAGRVVAEENDGTQS